MFDSDLLLVFAIAKSYDLFTATFRSDEINNFDPKENISFSDFLEKFQFGLHFNQTQVSTAAAIDLWCLAQFPEILRGVIFPLSVKKYLRT